jgi:hypothetical protein
LKPAEFGLFAEQVRHWTLDELDEAIPLGDQSELLDEDLVWVELERGVSIDVGWYRSTFLVFVIVDGDWDAPARRREAATLSDVVRELHSALAFARTLR